MNIIKKIISPVNWAIGRSGQKQELIVLHIMAGSISQSENWFKDPTSQVSSHYGIAQNGEIHQYVDEKDTAYANGRVDAPTAKLLKTGVNPNLYTISIEHEGQDLSQNPEIQIKASALLVADIAKRYNIPLDRDHVIGHYQIFSKKPFCPSSDKSIINKIIALASNDPIITIEVPQSKVEKVKAYLLMI